MNITIATEASKATHIKFISKSESESIRDFEGKSGSTTTRYEDNCKIVYISTGDNEISLKECRDSVANVIRKLGQEKESEVSITLTDSNLTASVIEGIILGDYTFDKYLTEKRVHVTDVELIGADEEQINKARVIAEGVCYARDLVNENAEIVTPAFLAEEAIKIANVTPEIEAEILTEKEIQEKGLGMLWAVGQGSSTPPRLIILKYVGDPSSEESIAIVGKGVTFDTGGLNLKPSGSIESMRSDMSGAAGVLGTIKAISKLKPKINVTAVVTSAQNAISSTAYFPGDIITAYNGTTVEVLNTDAEGRLCLGDAISYVKENYSPTKIVNMATLTGAIVIALGDTIAGLFSNNKEFKNELFVAGEEVGESLWEFPIRKEHHELLKSSIADLQNIGKKPRNAGSITAAAFLNHFAGDTPWCHLDIAGTSWNKEAPSGINHKFATGFGVRTLSNVWLE